MVCIITLDIFAAVLTVDDAEIGGFGIFGAIILQTLAFDADGTAGTYGSGFCDAGCAAVVVVGHGIDALDCIGCRAGTDIHKSCCALINACTIRAGIGIRVGNSMIRTFIVAYAAVFGIIGASIFAYVGTMNDAKIWCITTAGILNAAAADADRTAFADFAEIIGVFGAAIGVIGHWIDTFNGFDRRFRADIHIPGSACIDTNAFFTGLGCGILCRMF